MEFLSLVMLHQHFAFGGHLPFAYCSSVAVEEEYGRLGTTGHIILVYIFGALVLPFLGLLAQLLGFHVMLSELLTCIRSWSLSLVYMTYLARTVLCLASLFLGIFSLSMYPYHDMSHSDG